MEMALNDKNKLDFIDGSISKLDPDMDAPCAARWQHVNDIVSSPRTLLLESFSPIMHLLSSFIFKSVLVKECH